MVWGVGLVQLGRLFQQASSGQWFQRRGAADQQAGAKEAHGRGVAGLRRLAQQGHGVLVPAGGVGGLGVQALLLGPLAAGSGGEGGSAVLGADQDDGRRLHGGALMTWRASWSPAGGGCAV